jgi:E3 ubiquitin-protein ligase BRE1
MLQILAADRLSELEDARDENHTLSKELEDLEVCKYDLIG